MHTRLLRIPGALAALAGLALQAQATPYTIGTLAEAPTVYSQTASVSGSSFSDSYVFTLASGANTSSAAAVSLDLQSLLNIDNLVLSLFDSSGLLLASGSAGESSQLLAQSLTPGARYTYTVSGDVLGSAGGAYTFLASSSWLADSNSTALPEPDSLALLALSLCAAGLLPRLRRAAAGGPAITA